MAGLLHGSCVDVQLDVRMTTGAKVGFEQGRDHDDEHEPALVHRGFDLRGGDRLGRLKARRIEGVHQFLGQGGIILVDKSDRCIVDLARGAGRLDVDCPSERVGDEKHHHQIASEAAKLLQSKPENVQQRRHGYFSCFLKASVLTAQRIGMQQARKITSCIRRSGPSPLVKAPLLACI